MTRAGRRSPSFHFPICDPYDQLPREIGSAETEETFEQICDAGGRCPARVCHHGWVRFLEATRVAVQVLAFRRVDLFFTREVGIDRAAADEAGFPRCDIGHASRNAAYIDTVAVDLDADIDERYEVPEGEPGEIDAASVVIRAAEQDVAVAYRASGPFCVTRPSIGIKSVPSPIRWTFASATSTLANPFWVIDEP